MYRLNTRRGIQLIIILSLAILFLFFTSTDTNNEDTLDYYWKYEKKKDGKVVIHVATTFFGEPMTNKELDSCSEDVKSKCEISKYFKNSDAVVFHGRNMKDVKNIHIYEENRDPNVPYILWTMESPMNEKFHIDNGFINWTMSYKKDSEVQHPYGELVKREEQLGDEYYDKIWNNKNNSMIWIVSNCKTPNHRKEIVEHLMKDGLDISLYGDCYNSLPNCRREMNGSDICLHELVKQYKFAIAFENSNCKDYVTEKFWKLLGDMATVPIVISRDIYNNIGIPNSSYIALDDFQNSTQFIEYIRNIGNNKTEYMKYHRWRQQYVVKHVFPFCNLCKTLYDKKISSRQYDIAKWHSKDECDNRVSIFNNTIDYDDSIFSWLFSFVFN